MPFDWQDAYELVEQKLVEWSEEDERIYRSIAYSFAHNFPLTIQQQEFVKSLKDRYTWKPSDEQMEGFFWVLENCAEREGHSKMLGLANSIYDDLKKLREE